MRQRLKRRVLTGLVLAGAMAASGCGAPAIDVARSIAIGNLTTGWFDAGIVGGKNKLVPSASFTVTNNSAHTLSGLQVFSVFRFVGDQEELGSSLIVLRGVDALEPSATSKPVTVRANWGYTGEQPRAQMLMHGEFRDARVEIFAKWGSGPFVKLTEAHIERQLLTQ
ncbi:MAG: hypothetical protein AB1806_14360 [Acidobacteriota bacterium]